MGMTIEEKFKVLTDEYAHLNGKYAMMLADYENRLKADMVAMLTEIQLEIEEIRTEEPIHNGHGICGWEGKWAEDIIQECSKIIQEKINALKGE